MKTILILGTFGGLFLGLVPEINYFFFTPKIISPPDYSFIEQNDTVTRKDGEKFEVFYPPLINNR